jgi:hypothetical protein
VVAVIRIALLAAVAAALAAPSVASAAPTASNIGIATKASAFISVLDVAGGSTSLGAKVIQYPVNGGANQRWDLVRRADESVAIVSRASGLCLTTNGVAGAQLYLWTCDPANPRQNWTGPFTQLSYTFAGDLITNGATHLSIDVEGGSGVAGARVIGWATTGQTNQRFARYAF